MKKSPTQNANNRRQGKLGESNSVALLDELEVFLHPTAAGKLVPEMANVNLSHLVGSQLKSDSLQARILQKTTQGQKSHPLYQTFKAAVRSSHRLLGEVILGRGKVEFAAQAGSRDYYNAIVWRYAEMNAESAITIPLFKDILLARTEEGDVSFFIQLGKCFEQSQTALRISDLNSITLKMAEYWVHPDFPLWMMNNEAGSMYVGSQLGANVSTDNYAQIIKRRRLVRFGKFPISGIRMTRDKRVIGVELSRGVDGKV